MELNQSLSESEDEPPQVNKVKQRDQPIFLKRNLVKMKRQRKLTEKVKVHNGLVSFMIPMVHQIQYETNTEDFFIMQRDSKSLLGKRKSRVIMEDI